jgi:hypothetical protein
MTMYTFEKELDTLYRDIDAAARNVESVAERRRVALIRHSFEDLVREMGIPLARFRWSAPRLLDDAARARRADA